MSICSCVSCVSLAGSLFQQMLTKEDRLIIGSSAVWQLWALPGVEDRWRMTALLWGSDAERVCFFFSLLVSVCTCPCGSKASEAVSLAAQASKDVCHTVLIKRQQHAHLPLVLWLICSIQITNINQRRQISPQTTSLCCSFVLFLFISVFVLSFMATIHVLS